MLLTASLIFFKLKFPVYITFVFPDDNFCFLKVTTFDFVWRAFLLCRAGYGPLLCSAGWLLTSVSPELALQVCASVLSFTESHVTQPGLKLCSQSATIHLFLCLRLPSAGIMGVCDHRPVSLSPSPRCWDYRSVWPYTHTECDHTPVSVSVSQMLGLWEWATTFGLSFTPEGGPHSTAF